MDAPILRSLAAACVRRPLFAALAVALVLAGCANLKGNRRSAEPVTTPAAPAEAPPEYMPETSWPYPEAAAIPDGAAIQRLLKQVTFPAGSATLNGEARGALNDAVDLLKTNSAWHILVVGFTDNRGESGRAAALSMQRAKAVSDHFRGRGIDAARLHVQGLGSAHAKAGAYETVQAEQDRRAEVWAVAP